MDKKRWYNVFFHLHTVSGIVVSIALFIMFFAGGISMFKDEIEVWERGTSFSAITDQVDFDKIYKDVEKKYNLTGRGVNFNLSSTVPEVNVYVDHSHLQDATPEDLETHYFSLDLTNYTTKDYQANYSFSEFIYRLHFLSQIPYIGTYLAGLVSLFFLFAIITGVYIHWDKIIKNIVLFRPKASWKAIWTDAHAVLGTIGLPFQFMFAVTGAFFCLSTLVLIPAYTAYNGDYEKLYEDLRPLDTHETWEEISNKKPKTINEFYTSYTKKYSHLHVTQLTVENINGTNMQYEIIGELLDNEGFASMGSYAANAYNLKEKKGLNPYEFYYPVAIQRFLGRMHFGDYGGYITKFIYLLLAFVTCFVTISGVMIWLTARNKKNVPEKKKKFNFKVANYYISISLALIPVIALGLICSKFLPENLGTIKMTIVYVIFFTFWVALSVFFILKKDFKFTNRTSLLLSAIFFLLLPIVNGLTSGNWLWITFNSVLKEIFISDILFIAIGTISLFTLFVLNKKTENQ